MKGVLIATALTVFGAAAQAAPDEAGAADRHVRACEKAMADAQAGGAWHWDYRARVEVAAEDYPREVDIFTAQVKRVAAERAGRYGFLPEAQLNVGRPEACEGVAGRRMLCTTMRASGRTTNVTEILRASLKQVRMLGHNAVVTPDTMPVSWHDDTRKGSPMLRSRCQDVRGFFKYSCSYLMASDAECPWQERARELGAPREFVTVDRADVWGLLARVPSEYGFEAVLKVLGRPRQSIALSCSKCKQTEQRWVYDIRDVDLYDQPLHNILVFAFDSSGRCRGWWWEAS